MSNESSSREVLHKVTVIAGEIRNLSHYAWTDRENAEFLFRGIEQRGMLIQQELAALSSQSPSDRSLREVLKGLAGKWREKTPGYSAWDNAADELLAALASQPSGVESIKSDAFSHQDLRGQGLVTGEEWDSLSIKSQKRIGLLVDALPQGRDGVSGNSVGPQHVGGDRIRTDGELPSGPRTPLGWAIYKALMTPTKSFHAAELELEGAVYPFIESAFERGRTEGFNACMTNTPLPSMTQQEPRDAAAPQSPASSRPARGREVPGERERLVRVDEHLRTCTRCKANLHSHCDRWNQLMSLAARSTPGEPLTSGVPGERIKKLIEDLEGLKKYAKESSDGVGYQEGRYRAFAAVLTALKHELAVATTDEAPQPLQAAASPGSEREPR